MFNKNALFSDGTKDYRIPCEPMVNDRVAIRFRAGKEGIKKVSLAADNMTLEMERIEGDVLFDYYEAFINLTDKPITYYFEILCEEETWYYNLEGAVKNPLEEYNFQVTPGFRTPDWAKGAVIYQIFADRFYNGDSSNDVEVGEYYYVGGNTTKVTDWNQYPNSMGVREFYGGDLAGIIEKMDYLEDLGIEVIYLNPIFVSPSNHKYDIQDYDYVDPHLGVIVNDGGKNLTPDCHDNSQATKYQARVASLENLNASNEFFIKVVEEAHKRGMKVILDGVFNHCGSFNKWLDRERIYEGMPGFEPGAYEVKDSPYHSYFHFREDSWPYNGSYDGWWGYETLPKLNYEGSAELYNYILDIGKKWVSPPYNCDGWRLDVAADLGLTEEFNHKFWKDFRKSVKEANPDAIILAEHYGNPKTWLLGDEWDTVMNYDAFMEPLTWFLTGMEKHSDEYNDYLYNHQGEFFSSMRINMAKFQTSSLQTAMNELSNHDHSRFLTRTNQKVGRTSTLGPKAAEEGVKKGVLRLAVTVQMTWTGAPTIYYGDEAGVCGFTDPDNRRTYPWGNEDKGLIDFHREVIKIHKSYEALKTGSLIFLNGVDGVISYGRFDKRDKFIVAVNNNNSAISIDIDAWEVGLTDSDKLVRLILTTEEGYSIENAFYQLENGILKLDMPPVSSVIIKNV